MPELIRRRLAALVVVAALCFVAVACAPKLWVLTPGGKIAYTATQIVERVGELQGVVITANRTGAVPDRVAIPIVIFTVTSLKILDKTPDGWQATVAKAWRELKAIVPAPTHPIYAAAWGAVDVILAAFEIGPGATAALVDPALVVAGEAFLAAHGR